MVTRFADACLSEYARARIAVQPNGCWHWTGPINNQSYGVANLPGGKRDGAHRYVYKQIVGPLPPKEHLDHQCHNRDESCAGGPTCMHRRCVNPDHVEPATPRQNSLRGKTVSAANLAKETCPKGHPYSHQNNRGWRKCQTCIIEQRTALRRAAGVPESRAWATHCAYGHEYTEENTRWSKGYRYCKKCDWETMQARIPEKRKPCKGCGGPKGPGERYRYCPKCRASRASKPSTRRDTSPDSRTAVDWRLRQEVA